VWRKPAKTQTPNGPLPNGPFWMDLSQRIPPSSWDIGSILQIPHCHNFSRIGSSFDSCLAWMRWSVEMLDIRKFETSRIAGERLCLCHQGWSVMPSCFAAGLDTSETAVGYDRRDPWWEQPRGSPAGWDKPERSFANEKVRRTDIKESEEEAVYSTKLINQDDSRIDANLYHT
jgi:hypothetical protein